MRAAAWEPFFLDRKTDRLFTNIELLAGEMGGADAHVSREKRDALIERLPETVRRIAAYWRDPTSAFPRQAPVRATKVGRNEVCPLRLRQEVQEMLRLRLGVDCALDVRRRIQRFLPLRLY